MTEERKTALQKGIDVAKLIVLTSIAAAAIATALTFFAKATTVQALDERERLSTQAFDERFRLGTSQEIVSYKERALQWTEQRIAFQRREKPPTIAETEIVKKAEGELTEAKRLHGERVKHFEEQYKTQFK